MLSLHDSFYVLYSRIMAYTLHIPIDDETLIRLRERAVQEDRTVAGLARALLRRVLTNDDKPESKEEPQK